MTGLELRSCWQEGTRASASRSTAAPAEPTGPDPHGRPPDITVRGNGGPLDRPNPMRLRGFVPLDELVPPVAAGDPAALPPPTLPPGILADTPVDSWETRTSLFGDAEA